jgi:hypothetical protein
MKIVAWAWLILYSILICGIPVVIGQPRRPWDVSNWIGAIIGGAMAAAVCGRVLGWW